MTQRESIINLYDSSKIPKYDYDLGDRISALPDSILGLILSFLPTKNAVATSILSKRWEFAWVTVHNLYFQYYRIEHNEGERLKFVRFVNRVLLLHDAGFLNKFTLIWCSGCISSHVHSWINTAFTKNVHELSLFLGADDREFEMPMSVLNCSALRSLELAGGISVSEANVVCLPSLETLILAVDFQSEKAFEKLISGSPMLNYLDLNRTHEDAIMCIISSTSLTHLELHLGSKCSLKLDAPSLEYLMVTGGISEIFVLKGLSSLVDVDIQIDYEANSHNSIVEAVRAFDRAKTVNLSHDVMRALHRATINLSTEFKRLVKLQTEMYFCDYMSLQDFLQSSTNLEVLTICQWNDENYISELSKWTTPVKVPRCLSNSLKKVVITEYNGLEDGPEMIRYMLKHGSVLESIKIYCDHCLRDNEKLKLLQEICKFSRKSTACEVEFLPFWDSEQGQGPDLKKRASL